MCKYCDDEWYMNCTIADVNSGYESGSVAIDGVKSAIHIFVVGEDFDDADEPINYCPMCGRKLVSD